MQQTFEKFSIAFNANYFHSGHLTLLGLLEAAKPAIHMVSLHFKEIHLCQIDFKTSSADRIFEHDYQLQNNGNFSSNFKTRQNHKAVQQTFEKFSIAFNANYFHSGHLHTARSAKPAIHIAPLHFKGTQLCQINFKTSSADRIFEHDYQFQNNGNFSSNFKTRQNH